MKIVKAGSFDASIMIDIYQKKSLKELQLIQPKWAYRENLDKLCDYVLHPKNKEYAFFLTNASDLVLKSEFYEVNPVVLFTGTILNDHRISRILFQWENGNYVDPPTINISQELKDRLSFSDGRHRTKLAYLLGHIKIPVAIPILQIEEVKKIIPLSLI